MTERVFSSSDTRNVSSPNSLWRLNLKLLYSAETSPIVFHDTRYLSCPVALSGRPNNSLEKDKITWTFYFPAMNWTIFSLHDYIFKRPLTSSTPSFNPPHALPSLSYSDSISSSSSSFSHAVFSSTYSYVAPSTLRDSSPFLSYTHAPPSSATLHNSCDTFETESKSPCQWHPSSSPTNIAPSAATYNSNSSSSYLHIPSSTSSVDGSISLEQSDCKPAVFESWDCYSLSLVSDRISSARYYTTVASAES